jgi:hypothetical protein
MIGPIWFFFFFLTLPSSTSYHNFKPMNKFNRLLLFVFLKPHFPFASTLPSIYQALLKHGPTQLNLGSSFRPSHKNKRKKENPSSPTRNLRLLSLCKKEKPATNLSHWHFLSFTLSEATLRLNLSLSLSLRQQLWEIVSTRSPSPLSGSYSLYLYVPFFNVHVFKHLFFYWLFYHFYCWVVLQGSWCRLNTLWRRSDPAKPLLGLKVF